MAAELAGRSMLAAMAMTPPQQHITTTAALISPTLPAMGSRFHHDCPAGPVDGGIGMTGNSAVGPAGGYWGGGGGEAWPCRGSGGAGGCMPGSYGC